MCGVANGLQSGGGGGVALQGSLAGCVGLPESGNAGLGAGTTRVGDGGTMEQRERGGGVPRLPGEPGAKWSLLGMRSPGSPPPRCRVRLGVGGAAPPAGVAEMS